jgi:hypothetical protein
MRQVLSMEETLKRLGGMEIGSLVENSFMTKKPMQPIANSKMILTEDDEVKQLEPATEPEANNKKDLPALVQEFFKNNKEHNDEALHKFAEENKVDTHDLETAIYKTLDGYINGAMFKHGQDDDKNFDPEQLAAGIKVEHEHSDNDDIAKFIAKAHLSEKKDYYQKLQAAGL